MGGVDSVKDPGIRSRCSPRRFRRAAVEAGARCVTVEIEKEARAFDDRLSVAEATVEAVALRRGVQTGDGQAVLLHGAEGGAHQLRPDTPAPQRRCGTNGADEAGRNADTRTPKKAVPHTHVAHRTALDYGNGKVGRIVPRLLFQRFQDLRVRLQRLGEGLGDNLLYGRVVGRSQAAALDLPARGRSPSRTPGQAGKRGFHGVFQGCCPFFPPPERLPGFRGRSTLSLTRFPGVRWMRMIRLLVTCAKEKSFVSGTTHPPMFRRNRLICPLPRRPGGFPESSARGCAINLLHSI